MYFKYISKIKNWKYKGKIFLLFNNYILLLGIGFMFYGLSFLILVLFYLLKLKKRKKKKFG